MRPQRHTASSSAGNLPWHVLNHATLIGRKKRLVDMSSLQRCAGGTTPPKPMKHFGRARMTPQPRKLMSAVHIGQPAEWPPFALPAQPASTKTAPSRPSGSIFEGSVPVRRFSREGSSVADRVPTSGHQFKVLAVRVLRVSASARKVRVPHPRPRCAAQRNAHAWTVHGEDGLFLAQ